MDRRQFLLAGGVGASLGAAGFLRFSDSSANPLAEAEPTVTGSEPELSPGEEETVTITAERVRHMAFQQPESNHVELDFHDMDESPTPNSVYQSYPPGLSWDSATTVEITLPVIVAEKASPGEHHYAVEVAGPGSSGFEAEEFTITVREA